MVSPRRTASSVVVVLALALPATAALAPSALAAPPPGEGQLTIAPPALAFGPTTSGTTSAAQGVEIRNESGVAIAIQGIGLQGTEPSEFSTGSNSCGPTLPVGGSCTVEVFFSPHSLGAKEAVLRITSSAVAGEEDVPLSGTGVAPQLTFEPGSYDFGLQSARGEGGSETTFQVRNTGPASVHIDNTGFEGAGAEAFEFANGNCPGANLASGQTCSLGVRFRPRQVIPYAVDLRVTANGVGFTASLRGEGGAAIVTATPAALGFGSVGVGGAGLTQTITFANSGDLPANFFIAFLTGGDVADFTLLSEDCTKVPLGPAGGTCTAQIRFAPTDAGPKSSKFTLIAGGEDGPLQIDLLGTGTAPALTLAPAGLAFGPQGLGSSSATQTATLTNSGTSAVAVDAASISGPGADQFRLADSCDGATLEPGQSCPLAVRFSPDSEGPKSATLRILAGGLRLTAALSGTAAPTARVSFAPGGMPPRSRGASLAAGTFACEAQSGCNLEVRGSITFRFRAGGRVRVGRAGLPPLTLAVPAQSTAAPSFQLTPRLRRLLSGAIGTSHLQLRYGWTAEGQTGQGSGRLPVR